MILTSLLPNITGHTGESWSSEGGDSTGLTEGHLGGWLPQELRSQHVSVRSLNSCLSTLNPQKFPHNLPINIPFDYKRSRWKTILILTESASHSVVSNHLWPCGLYSLWSFPGQNSGVGSYSLLWGIFPTQGLNSSLPHYRWILYQLNHRGNLRILEWVAYPFSSKSSRPRNQTGVSCIAGRFFTNLAMREGHI